MSRPISAPPYSVSHAHKVIADFEHAVRNHTLKSGQHPSGWKEIERIYLDEKAKMFTRLTEPTISTRIRK